MRVIKRDGDCVADALGYAVSTRPLMITYGTRATALYPVMGENDAVSMHPAVCKKLGLSMDGSKVSFHLPLSDAAVEEAKSMLGKYAKGDGKAESVFTGLVQGGTIRPIIDAVVEEKALPLSEIDRILVSEDL